jgi:hypothetical protein
MYQNTTILKGFRFFNRLNVLVIIVGTIGTSTRCTKRRTKYEGRRTKYEGQKTKDGKSQLTNRRDSELQRLRGVLPQRQKDARFRDEVFFPCASWRTWRPRGYRCLNH